MKPKNNVIIRLSDGLYISIVNDTTFVETYSPLVASTFPDKKTAVKWLQDHTTLSMGATPMVRNSELIKSFEQWLVRMERNTFTILDKSEKYIYDPNRHSLRDIIEFYLVTTHLPEVPPSSKMSWPSPYVVFECILSLSKLNNGQNYCEMAVRKGMPFSTFISELIMVSEYMDNTTNFTVGIFDHFLGEFGNGVQLRVDLTENTGEIFGSDSFSGSVKECFNYIRKHRYYS